MGASRTEYLEDVGNVLFERSRRSKHINIYVMPFDRIRVAMPRGVSFSEAREAVLARTQWVKAQLSRMREYCGEKKARRAAPEVLDRDEARSGLIRRTAELAREHGFSPKRVVIREQKTRWGSCSPEGNISLNLKLAMLPRELTDYVILHELMHTKVRNHGEGFWRELDVLLGDAKSLDWRLRNYYLELM